MRKRLISPETYLLVDRQQTAVGCGWSEFLFSSPYIIAVRCFTLILIVRTARKVET